MADRSTRGRTRRRWSTARKAAIVAELREPGATPGIKRSSVTFPNDHAPRVFLGRPFGSGATRRPSMASICAWNRRVANGALVAVARLISSTASVANPPSNRPA